MISNTNCETHAMGVNDGGGDGQSATRTALVPRKIEETPGRHHQHQHQVRQYPNIRLASTMLPR